VGGLMFPFRHVNHVKHECCEAKTVAKLLQSHHKIDDPVIVGLNVR